MKRDKTSHYPLSANCFPYPHLCLNQAKKEKNHRQRNVLQLHERKGIFWAGNAHQKDKQDAHGIKEHWVIVD